MKVVVDRRAGQERSRSERSKLFLESEEVWRKGTAKRMTGQKRTEERRIAERGQGEEDVRYEVGTRQDRREI